MRILSAVSEAAERGAVCPTNKELAALSGYARRTVEEIISGLRDEGKIEVDLRGSRRRITIISTGRSTAPIPYKQTRPTKPRPAVTVGEMVTMAADIFDTTAKDIRSRAKFKHIVRPRQAVYIVASRVGWGASHIARAIGIDNSCIHHARKNEDVFVKHEPEFARGLAALDSAVRERCAA